MNTEMSQLKARDWELNALRALYPGLDFEDRHNPEHVLRYDDKNKAGDVVRPAKTGPNAESFLRFQAVIRTVDTVTGHPVRVLMAWAATPTRLAEILACKGGVK